MHSVISIKPPVLLSVLFLSAAPVQAFETIEELGKACSASEEIDNICTKAGEFVGTVFTVSLLCEFPLVSLLCEFRW